MLKINLLKFGKLIDNKDSNIPEMKTLQWVFLKNKMPVSKIKNAFLTASLVSVSFYSFSNELIPGSKKVEFLEISVPPRPLAYQLLSFKAEFKANSTVVINWSTESEKSTSHYILQKSIDGRTFRDAALLFTREADLDKKMEYSYTDHINDMKSKQVYYRLKVVTVSGKEMYSDAVLIRKAIPALITGLVPLNNEIASI